MQLHMYTKLHGCANMVTAARQVIIWQHTPETSDKKTSNKKFLVWKAVSYPMLLEEIESVLAQGTVWLQQLSGHRRGKKFVQTQASGRFLQEIERLEKIKAFLFRRFGCILFGSSIT